MTIKRILYSLLFLILFLQNTNAITWKTIAAGNWATGGVWQGGIAPSYTSSDTIFIKHNIIISNNLSFNANAVLQIDSSGGICGHYTVTVNSGAKILKYGTLDIDVINVPGGLVNFYNPRSAIATQYGVLTSGGQLNTFGCSFIVGPWFTCQFGGGEGGIEAFETSTFNIYPNPNNGNFVIETNTATKQTLQLHDISGKLVLSQIITGEAKIDMSFLNAGVYNISIYNNKGILNRKLVIVK